MEKEENGHISFLDTEVTRKQDFTFTTAVYRKPTNTGRYLQYDSHHPLSHKRAVVKTLMERAMRLSGDSHKLKTESQYIQDTLSGNVYPRHLFKPSYKQHHESEVKIKPRFRITLPYIQGISERIARLLAPYDVRVCHRPVNKLRSFFPSPKDIIPNDSRCGEVYNIRCEDCMKVYIGQTKNSLATRLGQHRAALRLMQPEKSALAEHSILTGHKINWSDPRIVEKESRWHQRLFLES